MEKYIIVKIAVIAAEHIDEAMRKYDHKKHDVVVKGFGDTWSNGVEGLKDILPTEHYSFLESHIKAKA